MGVLIYSSGFQIKLCQPSLPIVAPGLQNLRIQVASLRHNIVRGFTCFLHLNSWPLILPTTTAPLIDIKNFETFSSTVTARMFFSHNCQIDLNPF